MGRGLGEHAEGHKEGRQMAMSPVLKGGKAPVNPVGPRGEERGRVLEAAWLCLHLFPANEQDAWL